MRALVVVTIVGFPVAFVLAWVLDTRPEGLIFDLPLWRGIGDDPREETKSDLVVVAILAVVLVAGTFSVLRPLYRDISNETTLATNEASQDAKARSGIAEFEAPLNSIAVLAFENFDGLAETSYFAGGLAEEILNLLAGIDELKVAARTSSFQFRGRQVGVPEVAQLLNVRHVLEGSVRQEGDRIRVTAQLINGATGFHNWSKTYERDLESVFSIQQEIAAAVVNELRITLSVNSAQRLQMQPTENIDAYVLYLQGRDKLRSSPDPDVIRTASVLFHNALEIDPLFSRAHSGICEANLGLYAISNAVGDFTRAESACAEAARLDPGLNSENYLALGTLYRFDGQYEQAEEEIRKAIAISPSNSDAYIELGEIRMAQDQRADAEANFLRAVDLQRTYWKAQEALASFYYKTERYDESVAIYETVTMLAPDGYSGFTGLGAARWMQGDTESARVAWDRSSRLKPNRTSYTNTGIANYYTGRFAEAVEMQLRALEYADEDHLIWGRLAESYRFIPGRELEATQAYEQAAKFAESSLTINASDWRTAGLLGVYFAHLGRNGEVLQLVDNAVVESNRNAEALYYQALARLTMGDEDSALDALEEAVAADRYYQQFVESDPDLQAIRGNERLEQLRSGAGK